MSFAKLVGVEVLERNSELLLVAMREGAKLSTEAGAKALADDWRSRAPVSTGGYRDSIQTTPTDDGWMVFSDSFKSYLNEYGTRYMQAQPSLTPAYETHKHDLPRIVAEVAGARIEDDFPGATR